MPSFERAKFRHQAMYSLAPERVCMGGLAVTAVVTGQTTSWQEGTESEANLMLLFVPA
jgi:hypothetical protein